MSDTVVVGVIGAVLTALVGVLAWTTNRNSVANAFTKNLLDRLDSVEDDLDSLKAQLTTEQGLRQAAVRLIDRLYEWGSRGGKGKVPQPTDDLRKYLDPTLWQQDHGPSEGSPGTGS